MPTEILMAAHGWALLAALPTSAAVIAIAIANRVRSVARVETGRGRHHAARPHARATHRTRARPALRHSPRCFRW